MSLCLAQNSWPMFRQNAQHTGTLPSATFVGLDQCTPEPGFCEPGTWQDGAGNPLRGTQGYNIIGNTQNYPGYFQVTASPNTSFWTWAPSTTDIRAVEKAPPANDRIAACWFAVDGFSLEVAVTDSSSHKVGLYFLDWQGGNQRAQRIDVYDVHSGFLLDSQAISNFSDGAHLFWGIKGRVRFEFSRLSGANAVLSGIFLDP